MPPSQPQEFRLVWSGAWHGHEGFWKLSGDSGEQPRVRTADLKGPASASERTGLHSLLEPHELCAFERRARVSVSISAEWAEGTPSSRCLCSSRHRAGALEHWVTTGDSWHSYARKQPMERS